MDCGSDNKVFRRLNAIHLLLVGASYDLVLRNSRVCDRMLRLWISRFNAQGIDGLTYRPRPGRPRKLAAAKIAFEILPLIDDPALAGQTHWTVVKLCGWLREEKEINLSYRTLVRYLHEHQYVRKIPRPVPEPPDRDAWEDKREAFAFELLGLLEYSASEVFFGDEAGFEGDPRPRAKWVKRGSRPTQAYQGSHVRQNVIGAVNPATGQLVSLIVPHCDTAVFQIFLDAMAAEVSQRRGKRVVLDLDNAGWHKTKSLRWHHIELVYLPPYSPDFNLIERLWQHLKGHYLAGYFTKHSNDLSDKLVESIQHMMDRPKIIRSVCKTHSA
jgi:transposase